MHGAARRVIRYALFSGIGGCVRPGRLNNIAVRGDVVAGLVLAAIGIPEQMATAQLAGLSPQVGLVAFIAATVGFSLVGFRRVVSVGADSTIAPIFSAGLLALALAGSPQYAALAALLAVAVGIILIAAERLGLGRIADLFSIPVTTGFLAGIAIHIIILQLPAFLGLPGGTGSLVDRVRELSVQWSTIDLGSVALGSIVLLTALISEKVSSRIPGALIGLLLAASAMMLSSHLASVQVLGAVHLGLPRFALPSFSWTIAARLMTLAFLVSAVVMLQTAAVLRSFGRNNDSLDDVSRTFASAGMANIFAGIAGAMPVNTSPPRTAVLKDLGATSQLSSLVAAGVALAVGFSGAILTRHVPSAALAGILLFIALRILRLKTALEVFRQSRPEFALILATMAAIVFLPTETGVSVGIIMSLLHGMWTNSHARVIEFERVPGTTVWWAPGGSGGSEKVDGILVLAFPAPLSFLNAYEFRRGVLQAIASRRPASVGAIVLEANGIAEIDFTAAQILKETISGCTASGIVFAVARLESERAEAAIHRFGLDAFLGPDRRFHTVEEAVARLSSATMRSG